MIIMNQDNIEHDLDYPQDITERKIQKLERDIAKISKTEDKKIIWGVVGILVILVLYKLLKFNPIIITVIPIVIIGGITIMIYENIQKKRNVLIKNGLKCSRCGHLPRITNASGLYYSRQCPKCHASLNI